MIKKIPHIIYLFFLLISCNNVSKTPEEEEDFQEWNESEEHEAVGEEEIFITEYDEEWEYEEDFEEETSYIITEKKEYFKSKFKNNQIQNNVYFVYEEDGTSYFRNQNLDSVDYTLTFGKKITVIEKTEKEYIDNIKHLSGKVWKVKDEKNRIGYVNSSVLSPIPFYANYENKGLNNMTQILHLVDSVMIEEQKSSHNSEPFWQRKTYYLENQIKLETYFDLSSSSSGSTLIVPSHVIDMYQSLVFFDFITEISIIGSIFKNNFPKKNVKKKVQVYGYNKLLDTDLNLIFHNDEFKELNFNFTIGEAHCKEYYSVYKSKNKIIFTLNKGF